MGMKKETRLTLAIVLSLTFMIFEVGGGIWANSLAILSDAAHLLTDVAGFGIALLATLMANAPASKHYSFGLARAEVMGALASILSLWVMTACLIIEAYNRTISWYQGDDIAVDGKLMFVIACIGVVVNLCLSCVFMEDHGGAFHSHDHDHGSGHSHDHGHSSSADVEKNTVSHKETSASCDSHGGHDHGGHDHSHGHSHQSHGESEKDRLIAESPGYGTTVHDHSHITHHGNHPSAAEPTDVNIQAAYLHVITDLIQSVGVAIAGLLIWIWPEYQILDPVCTFLFSGLVMWSTFSLLGRVMTILFEGVPAHVDYMAVLESLQGIPGVEDVHDLHIWSISSQATSLTCHIIAQNPQHVLEEAHKLCSKLGIHHSTIQVQDSANAAVCCQNPQVQCM